MALLMLMGLLASGAPEGGTVCALAETWFEPPQVSAMTGNGRLTAGVDTEGRVVLCRWPSPGCCNQVRCPIPPANPRECGLAWAIRFRDRFLWITPDAWTIRQEYAGATNRIETTAVLSDPSVTVKQTLFVDSTRDVIVARCHVSGEVKPSAIYWCANFSPCTRVVPEMPFADWALDDCNDFAAFSIDSGRTVCHFRPRQPGSQAWVKAEHLAARPGPEWTKFEDGAWIVYGSPNAVAGFQCGTERTPASAFRQAEAGQLTGRRAAVGACDSALALEAQPEGDGQSATVFIAFGAKYAESQANLNYALERGTDALWGATRGYWDQRLSEADLPATDDAATIAACKRDLVTLLQSTDRATGAIVRWPWALDRPGEGVWTTFALDLAGYHDVAEAHTFFYAGAVRREGRRGKPYGSLPAACYANQVEALPPLVLDSEAAAWTLASMWRHAGLVGGGARYAYLERAWEPARLMGEFLVAWTDGRTREPLGTFDRASCRDARSLDLLLTIDMGIDAALRIAEAAGKTAPTEWVQRKRDLDGLVRFHCVDLDSGQWKVDEILPFWRAEFAQAPGAEFPSWSSAMDRRLKEGKHAETSKMLADLCDAALVWKGRPERTTTLRAMLQAATAAVPPPGHAAPPDAFDAARHFIATSLIYPPAR